MKLLLQEYRRRTIVPIAALALGVYYLLVYVPLGNRAEALDEPLQKAWHQLTSTLGITNAPSVDFQQITNQLAQTRQALSALDVARQKAAERLDLAANVKARMSAPFYLVEYESERDRTQDNLLKLAKKQQVTIDSGLFLGFPEHTADVRQPELLWAALSMIDGLLTSALQAKVTAIHSLETPVTLTNAPPPPATLSVSEIPIQLELSGSVSNVARLIQTLPMRGPEIKASGLLEGSAEKPPLFIDRLILKKQSPEKPDEVRLWLRVTGFVIRE